MSMLIKSGRVIDGNGGFLPRADIRIDGGQVTMLEPLASDTYVEVGRAGLSLTAHVEPDCCLSVGETATLQLPREKLHFFHVETHLRLELEAP
ncbi:MAG: hypothetical protein O2967_22820 [Proteobacteria bacterium]|nr:hypothetical protein [Pseudomonadota bacterium]